MHRIVCLLALLGAAPADAQPAPYVFRQPYGAYEFRIRAGGEMAPCDAEDAPLFAGAEGAGCPEDGERFELWHHGRLVDALTARRLWLGPEPDTLLVAFPRKPPEALPIPRGAVRDLTGDGTPELVVAGWSGGAHCCTTFHVVELGDAPRLLGVVEGEDSDVLAVEDRDGDGTPELVVHDWTFAYWNASFAGSPAPAVALAWDGEQFAPSPAHMRRAALPATELALRAKAVRDDPAWAGGFPPAALWAALLDLLYGQQPAQARDFLARAWPGDALGRAVFTRYFDDQLMRSPYAGAVEPLGGW